MPQQTIRTNGRTKEKKTKTEEMIKKQTNEE